MQIFNPILIVTLIPLFEVTLYPCLKKLKINFRYDLKAVYHINTHSISNVNFEKANVLICHVIIAMHISVL